MQDTVEDITRRISAMYDLFPYPSPEPGPKNLKELSNLLAIFSTETGYDFRGKTVLDAGTGTGHRLLDAAATYKETKFVAIDVSGRPLAIAREKAREQRTHNVEWRRVDLMDASADLGRFDVILCTGVLQHLADPVLGMRNLVRSLAPRGLILFYVYGSHGSRERMRRKQVLSLLLGKREHDFNRGIEMITDLGFASYSNGWNLSIADEKTRESLCAHSYLSTHEHLFEADSLFALARDSGLHGFMTYGITVEQTTLLFESRLNARRETLVQRMDLTKQLSTPLLIDAYERLNLMERYRVIDLIYQPNGYTVIGMQSGTETVFDVDGRVRQNTVTVATGGTRRLSQDIRTD